MNDFEEPDVEQSSTLILGSEVELPFRESLIRSPSRVLELESDEEESQLSAQKPTLDVTPEGIATWRSQIARASTAERERFLKYRAGDLQTYISAIEKTVIDHGENSLGLKVARGLNPIFKTLNLYAPIAQTMIQTDPTSSSLILGGITCIMAISARFEEYQEKTSAMLSGMLEKLNILMKYGENIYKNNAQMQEVIMKVFGDVLDFCVRASRLFIDDKGKLRKGFRTFITSLGNSFESKFSDVLSRFDADIKSFKEAARYVDRERQVAASKRMDKDRLVAAQYMQYSVNETYQIHCGVVSIGQQMSTVEQKHREEIEKARMEEFLLSRGEKRRKIISWLPSISFHQDQENKNSKRLDGTGDWLVRNETFNTWKDSEASQLLWIHGKNGCGKSYLAARVVRDLTEDIEQANKDKKATKDIFAVAYIYCNSLEAAKIDPSKLIGSLLNQLCHSLPIPDIEQSLENLYDRQSEAPTRQDMQRAILSIMARLFRTYIIIDGLDECHTLEDELFKDLCEFVNSLAQPRALSSVAKVVVFSRPEYPTIKEAFGECLKIQVDNGLNTEDIKDFISKKTSGKDLHLRYNADLREEVEGILLSRADGMFLWADLSVKALRGARSAKEIRKRLGELPQGLDKRYEASMQRILNQDDYFVRTRALKILLWVTNAKRPLSREELREALAIEPEMATIDEKNETKIHDDSGFAAECGDLVVIGDGSYHLCHSSLKTYLENLPALKSDLLNDYGLMQKDAAKILGETCLTYLMLEPFRTGPLKKEENLKILIEEYPLLQYAAKYWGRHVADAKGAGLLQLTKQFFSLDGVRDFSMKVFWQEQNGELYLFPGKTTPLHFLSIFNLVDIARELSDVSSMRTDQDALTFTPLDYAFHYQSKEMCIWILEDRDNTSPVTRPLHSMCGPIHMAATHDWPDVVERLLALKYNPEAKFGIKDETPLHLAASEGSEAAMKALLKANVNVNVSDRDGDTPLINAANSNHPQLATLLVEAGADVHLQGWNQLVPLHYAAIHGTLSIAEALFDKGAEVEPLSDKRWSFRAPLHLAAEKGQLEFVDLLIRKGADVNKSGPRGCTPLLLTCSNGHPACLKRLLGANAKIDDRDDLKQSCFHLAAWNGFTDVLKILVENCQDSDLINSTDIDGDTPLQSAIWNGKIAQAKFLLEHGAMVDKLNNRQQSALHYAINEDQLELAEVLVTQYKADTAQKDSTGRLALHHAAHTGCYNLLPLLLGTGVDPNSANDTLNTALHLAAMANKLEFIKKFVEIAPSVDLASKNSSGRTPLHMAASGGYTDIVEFFLGPTASSIQEEDIDKNLPLNLAAWNGHLGVIKLLSNKGNIDSRGYYGQTPIFSASSAGHTQIVEYLLEKGANPNILDDYNESPLFAALRSRQIEIANILLDHRADPKVATKYGETALHMAGNAGNVKMVRRLLEDGNDGLRTSAWNMTPFMAAVSTRNLEMVDVFIEHGFNGTTIPGKSGRTCIHTAAETGSLDMLRKLTADNKEFSLVQDCMNRDALNYAAATGQVNMIEPLIELGLSLNGAKDCRRRSIVIAASSGYFEFVSRLIDLGADVNLPCGYEASGALHIATSSRRPLISELLVKAGADPKIRNAFGLSSLDYAFKDKHVWEKMGDARDNYTPIELEKRMPALRKIIKECVEIILALPQEQNSKTEFERLDCLENISNALREIGTAESRERARLCYNELASPPELSNFSYTWDCNMCLQITGKGKRFQCSECFSTCLCGSCYSDYVEGSENARCIPKWLEIVQKLENDLKPIRNIVKPFITLGASFLYCCSDRVLAVAEWIDEKLKAYDEWEKEHNISGRLDSYKRPGQIYLKLIKRARKVFKDVEKDGLIDVEEITTKIDEEIIELYHEHKPDKEIPDFNCSGHHYIEIRDMSSMENSDKECFGADGKLKAEWLSELLPIYQDVAVESEAKGGAEHSLSRSDSYLDPRNVQDGRSALGDEIMILTHVLTDEPAEIADSNGVTNQEVSGEHKPNPVSSTIQCSSDTGTEKVNHVSQYNRQLLLRIRRELETQMRLAVKETRAAREAESNDLSRDDMRLPVSKETLNGGIKSAYNSAYNSSAARTDDHTKDSLKQIPSYSKQENHTEKSKSNGNDDDPSKDKTEPGKQLEEFTREQQLLFLDLMECEVAWKFTQLVLYGIVKESLLESVFGDERNNSNGVDQEQPTVKSENNMLGGISTNGETRPLDDTKEKHNAVKEELVLVGQNVQLSKMELEIEVESHAWVGERSDEGREESDGEGGDPLTKLHGGGKAVEKVVSNLRQTSIDDTVISQERCKGIRQASIDIQPPSPLSRRTTDLLARLI